MFLKMWGHVTQHYNPKLATEAIDKIALQRGYIWYILHIDGEGIILTHGCQIVNVREHVSVPLIDRIRMRRVFLQAQDFNIMVQQGDTWLSVPEEDNSSLISTNF